MYRLKQTQREKDEIQFDLQMNELRETITKICNNVLDEPAHLYFDQKILKIVEERAIKSGINIEEDFE